jgi:Arc/MetJ family transcription regulator
MRTTLDLDEALVAQAMKALGANTKTDAIHRALLESVRLAAGRQLVALGGKLPAIKAPARRRITPSRSK